MPIYQYTCPSCHAKKEQFRPVESREAPIMCRCGTHMYLVSAPRPSQPPAHVDARVPVRDVFKKV